MSKSRSHIFLKCPNGHLWSGVQLPASLSSVGEQLESARCPTCNKGFGLTLATDDDIAAALENTQSLRDRLLALAHCEEEYRRLHDLNGGGNAFTGRAWDHKIGRATCRERV